MKNNDRLFYTLILIFASVTYNSQIFSQNSSPPSVSGIITDTEGPLAGVNILVKNTTRGAISDLQGAYSIRASTNDTLIFTYLGYKTQEVRVGARTIVNIQMQPDATALDQVVINAGYYKVSDREKTGSISRITAKEIESQPIINPLEALQGRTPGLSITPTTGLPGGGFQVRIRGQSSIASGNEPLFVIDGIPYDSKSLSDGYVSGSLFPDGNASPLNSISPSNIENIVILKDADATAIYGSRGANGVILITTKEGVAGKTRYTVKLQTSLGNVARFQKLLHTKEYIAMREEAFANDGITEYPDYEYDINGTWDKNRYTDWQKELIGKTAYRKTLNANVSGGVERTRYLLSGEYLTETTVFPGDSRFNRVSVNSAFNHSDKSEKMNIKFNTNYSVENNTLPSSDLTLHTLFLPPNAPALYDHEGNLNWEDGTFTNPLSILEGEYVLNRKTLLANLGLHYKISPSLAIRVNTGYQNSLLNESLTFPHTIYTPYYGLGPENSSIFVNNGDSSSWIAEPQIEWETRIFGGRVSVLAGATLQEKTAAVLSYYGNGFASNELIHNFAAASSLVVERDHQNKYKYEALYGRFNYNWKNRYLVNITGRRDGSSRFGPGRKIANFGAVGVAWVFSEEPFLSENTWLSHGKLRGSYGSTGNDQIGDYAYLDTYTVSGTPYGGIIGIGPTQLFNPNFGWEINKKGSLALEMELWKNRISFTGEWYISRSSNQLVHIPLPSTTGFPSIQANLGAVVENRGWELSLHTVNFKNQHLTWSTDLNLTLPKNKLVAFPDLQESTYANQYVIGQPVTIKKVFHYTGIDPQTGVYQFEDYNGDGIISAPDQQFFEDIAPKFYGGITNDLKYRNWNLSFFFQFTKQKAYNHWLTGSPAGVMVNQPIDVLNHWQNPGDLSQTQIYTSGDNVEATTAFYNFVNSDAVISDASYIRLKNMALSYNLSFQEQLDCKIFLQAQNLLTFTKYKGGDPEQINGYVPPLRWIGGGFQLTF